MAVEAETRRLSFARSGLYIAAGKPEACDMADEKTSQEWSPAAIKDELERQARSGKPVSAQVFFNDDVAGAALPETVSRVIEQAEKSVGKPGTVTLGKVRPSANSASVSGDPDAIGAMLESAEVKTVLPNVVDDILPKPVKRELR
ncbi:hypothetical protein LJR234_004852 [Mesorhizobium amorphae]|uniref:hypothetical protein n=1 Tax=Mesorhizobium amorphae TaxID=71433 RepID=UPI003ECC4F01